MGPRALRQGSILALIVLGLAACSSKSPAPMPLVNSEGHRLQWQNGLVCENGTPFTGRVYTLLPNGRDTSEVVGFNHGLEQGEWKKYYPDGSLAERRSFNQGRKTGDFYAWWPNGVTKLYYHFENGEYDGVCREWTDNGTLAKQMTYRQGYEEGLQRQFYADGRIKSNYVVKSGRRYGLLGTKNCTNVKDSVAIPRL